MSHFFKKIKTIWTDRSLRKRVLFVIFAFFLFRLLASIPVPGVNTFALESFLANNQFFGVLNIFSGGGLSTLSIVMLGVGPYITASIIMQLLTIMFPRLKEMYHEEGEMGRRKFAQYSRILTVPLAVLQGLSLLIILERQGVILPLSMFDRIENVIVIVAGSMLLMWLGELVSEYGIGNGVSLIIFAGIVASFPSSLSQLIFAYDPTKVLSYVGFAAVSLVVVALVVAITEAERPIPVTYARASRGGGGVSSYIPLRINQAGVMPIIFALSILTFPQIIGNFLTGSSNQILAKIAEVLSAFSRTSVLYIVLYFFLVFLFTYFYTAITFDPESVSNNLQKNGAFVPGTRPGEATANHIGGIVTRVTLVGALFLATIAILPLVIQKITGITAIALGGTALLIVVNVITDFLKKLDAQVSMREY